ncbi:MAG: hypothetical protein IIY77_02980 [Lachnospiraceae bacterium]|nr:hypothetical protein [Lachnospiraceae bacterium]
MAAGNTPNKTTASSFSAGQLALCSVAGLLAGILCSVLVMVLKKKREAKTVKK